MMLGVAGLNVAIRGLRSQEALEGILKVALAVEGQSSHVHQTTTTHPVNQISTTTEAVIITLPKANISPMASHGRGPRGA
eukprot:6236059-Karenia_brevis.AAC.1